MKSPESTGTGRLFWTAAVFLVLVRLWVGRGVSLYAIGGAGHDDRLFLNLAQQLLRGEWLGPFNSLTLIKGPLYPLWVAAVCVTGVPLLLAQDILYCAACCFFIVALRPALPRSWSQLFILALLLFNPIIVVRVLRDGIYQSLSMLTLSAFAGLMLRFNAERSCRWLWAILAGCFLGSFWLTREEGVWILPAVAVILLPALFSVWNAADWKRRAAALSMILVPFLVWQGFLAAVSAMNFRRYGIGAVTEMSAREFVAAYGALARIKDDVWRPTVPVSRASREKAYAVSPAFTELRPFLEGDVGAGWAAATVPATPFTAGEIGGGWFIWALRDAAERAGHYAHGVESRAFYARMATELHAACDSGSLPCRSRRDSLAPRLDTRYIAPFLDVAQRFGRCLARFCLVPLPVPASVGDAGLLQLFRDLAGERISQAASTAPRRVQLRGWAVGFDAPVEVELLRADGTRQRVIPLDQSSPDVAAHFRRSGREVSGADRSRFSLWVRVAPGAVMRIVQGGVEKGRLDLRDPGRVLATDDFAMALDELSSPDTLPITERRQALQTRVFERVADTYQWAGPILVTGGLLFFLFATIRSLLRRRLQPIWFVIAALWGAVATRIAILALVEVASFPAEMYLTAAVPCVLGAVGLSFFTGWRQSSDGE